MRSKIAIYKPFWCKFSNLFYNLRDLPMKKLRCSSKTRLFLLIVVILIADVCFSDSFLDLAYLNPRVIPDFNVRISLFS